MTISSTTNRNDYIGNGATSVYSYSFKIFAESDLLVTKRTTADVETTLVLTTDYTVTGEGETAGGTITLTAGNLPSGYALTIRRVRDLTQETDIRNQGDFYPEGHEDAFDHFIMIDQQQQDEIDRSAKFPETVDITDFDPELPADLVGLDGYTIQTNAAGDGFEVGPSAADISGAAAYAAAAAASAAAAAASAAQAATYSGTNSPYNINNFGIGAAVAVNALTISVVQSDGSTTPATAAQAAMVWFRSSTATNGGFYQRLVTSALTLVVPSGATLGHNDALADYIYVYALDNAGTVELAVSSSVHWDEGQVQSTSAIGTGSDDGATLYSTSARTNVAIRLVGRILSSQTTAGTYATAPSSVQPGFLFVKEKNPFTRAANFQPKHGGLYSVSTASARSLQLPVPRAGWFIDIKDSTNQSGTNAITLVRNGSESIDGVAASKTLSSNGGSWRVYSDGTNWFTIFSSANSTIAYNCAMFDGPGSNTSFAGSPTKISLTADANSVNAKVTESSDVLTFTETGTYRVRFDSSFVNPAVGSYAIRLVLYNTSAAAGKLTLHVNTLTADGANSLPGIHYEGLFSINVTEQAQNFELQGDIFAGSGAFISANSAPVWRVLFEKVAN